MRRREFVTLLGGAVASPILPAVNLRAQQTALTRVGIVTIQSPTSAPYAAFRQRLRELGYIEGQNLTLDFVNPTRQSEGSAGAIQELIRLKVDLVLAIYQATMAAVVAAAPGMPVVMVRGGL